MLGVTIKPELNCIFRLDILTMFCLLQQII